MFPGVQLRCHLSSGGVDVFSRASTPARPCGKDRGVLVVPYGWSTNRRTDSCTGPWTNFALIVGMQPYIDRVEILLDKTPRWLDGQSPFIVHRLYIPRTCVILLYSVATEFKASPRLGKSSHVSTVIIFQIFEEGGR
jgi:hypothetical protein